MAGDVLASHPGHLGHRGPHLGHGGLHQRPVAGQHVDEAFDGAPVGRRRRHARTLPHPPYWNPSQPVRARLVCHDSDSGSDEAYVGRVHSDREHAWPRDPAASSSPACSQPRASTRSSASSTAPTSGSTRASRGRHRPRSARGTRPRATHMAGTYARMTGRLGVCMASNGPGVANVLPGVAVENGEGNRVLLLTSSRRTGIGSPDRGGTFQYFDQTAVTRAMTKWSGHVPSRDRIPEMLRRALRMSFRGRPGVVHLDIPEDVLNGDGDFDESPGPPAAHLPAHRPAGPGPGPARPGRRPAVGRAPAPDPRRLRHLPRRGRGRARPAGRAAGRAGHHVVGGARGAARDLAARHPDDGHRADRHRPQRGRRRADRRVPPGRDRLVGQGPQLGPAVPAAPHPGRRRRGGPRAEQARRPRHPRRRPRDAGARWPSGSASRTPSCWRRAGARWTATRTPRRRSAPSSTSRWPTREHPLHPAHVPVDRAEGAARGHRLGLRRRQHDRVGQLLPRGPHPPVGPVHLQVRHARRRAWARPRGAGRGPGPHRVLHHR